MQSVTAQPEDRIDAFSAESWQAILARGSFFEAQADETLLEYEATDQHLMIILSGKTTLVYLQDGKPAPTAIFREAGEVLHHAGMHLQIPNPFRIDAVDDGTRVVMLDRDAVYDLISSDVTFAEFLFRDLSERFMTALGYLREQRSAPLIIRLAKRILTITRHRPSVEFTQTELADILAVTRISISKAIKTLEEQGLIQRAERGVLSVNRDKLEAWVEAEVQATGE
ncbi:MAG: Crp/Fnr family transcriptional regulator [Hyphomonadaceae bacterium]|nr:Crp/Fnr family transcriptional regulator [Hyphomonadaceae bacterium]